jgi:hypothetical protein
MIDGLRAGMWKRRAGARIVVALAAATSLLAVMGVAGTAAPAQASPGPATSAQFPHRQDVTGPGDGYLTSVSCPTTSFCAAIDQDRAAVIYNGSSLFDTVSCASATFCVASTGAQVVTFNGTRWSAPVTVDAGNDMDVLSCPTSSFCLGVDRQGNTLTFNGSRWSTPTAGASTWMNSVSCPTANFCAAVTALGTAATYLAGHWSAPVTVDSDHPISGVSCPSATSCLAVDFSGLVKPAQHPAHRRGDVIVLRVLGVLRDGLAVWAGGLLQRINVVRPIDGGPGR